MSGDDNHWLEDDSRFFIEYGDVITPSRHEQLAMLTSLVPAEPEEEFVAVDLGCGAGSLSGAILERFSQCRMLALDYSPAMLEQATANLARFGDRVQFHQFDLFERDWLDTLPAVRCFASSLAIHHLDDTQKHQLFGDLTARLEPGGALLIIDLVEPVNPRAARAYAEAWDDAVRHQSQMTTGSLDAYERFRDGWNHYATPDVEFDKPSGLYEQLGWLTEAGLDDVDCFWLRAGHALYGGYKR